MCYYIRIVVSHEEFFWEAHLGAAASKVQEGCHPPGTKNSTRLTRNFKWSYLGVQAVSKDLDLENTSRHVTKVAPQPTGYLFNTS